MSRAMTPLLTRVCRRLVWQPDGCWTWTGSTTANGYGLIGTGGRAGRTVLVHRALYELLIGPVPSGLDLDHLCRQRSCANPQHLEPVNRSTNLLRGDGPRLTRERAAATTRCPAGHTYDDANTYVHNNKRTCRACSRAKQRRYLERKRATS